MVPFVAGTPFSGLDRRYPSVMLKSLSALLLALGFAELVPAARWLVAPAAALAGAALLALALRWCRVQSLRPRLLRMLFAGFVWLGLALLLSGVAGWLPQRAASAPLHAFTIGFLGSTMLAMLSRFACVQAGRAVVADGLLWGLFLLLQVAAVARVGGPLMAVGPSAGGRVAMGLAASIWATVWLAWLVRYGFVPRPRAVPAKR
jgi:uncharacterized protein involved in response to NO